MPAETPVNGSRSQPRRISILRRIGRLILSAGLAIAALEFFFGADNSSVSDSDALAEDFSKRASAQMRQMWGNVDSISLRLRESLRHPGARALLIAAITLLIALVFLHLARRLEED